MRAKAHVCTCVETQPTALCKCKHHSLSVCVCVGGWVWVCVCSVQGQFPCAAARAAGWSGCTCHDSISLSRANETTGTGVLDACTQPRPLPSVSNSCSLPAIVQAFAQHVSLVCLYGLRVCCCAVFVSQGYPELAVTGGQRPSGPATGNPNTVSQAHAYEDALSAMQRAHRATLAVSRPPHTQQGAVMVRQVVLGGSAQTGSGTGRAGGLPPRRLAVVKSLRSRLRRAGWV